MTRERFEFALSRLGPARWEDFEKLAATFLADEYPNLRTLAGPGDGGRDGILWQPEDDPTVVLQYSVSQDWPSKIIDTADKVSTNFPGTQVLTYVTNARIGPKGDECRTKLRTEHRLHLDIRDLSWFVDREHRSRATASSAEEFSSRIVDPILAKSSLLEGPSEFLTEGEARAAVVFLSLHWEDENRQKGLTKLSFEALVRAALRDTDSDRRMSRTEVCQAVRAMIRHQDSDEVDKHTNAALGRLTKRLVRHWKAEDEFCLTFAERERLTSAVVRLELLDVELQEELLDTLVLSAEAMELPQQRRELRDVVPFLRRVLESFLLQRGEAFAQGLSEGQMVMFTREEIDGIATSQIRQELPGGLVAADLIPLVGSSVEKVLVRPSEGVQRYLRALADGYMLFAFLRQVPDVQRAVGKIFGHGRIWLDTTAALPVLAEMLLDEEERSYTHTLKMAQQAGMDLFVTPGVIDELLHHIKHARRCQQHGAEWRSRVPFLYSVYLWSGRRPEDFGKWTAEFMGSRHQEEDIAEFLNDVAGIAVRSLAGEVEQADEDFRWQVQEYWEEVHRGRSRASDGYRDPEVARLLAEHDVENFLGVIVARQGESRTAGFGYEHWWLTLDRGAYRAAGEIAERAGIENLESPVMSFDFLINYVAIGPRRADIAKSEEQLLPLMLDMSLLDGALEEILKIAESTRDEFSGSSERLVRREIRDRLDAAKQRQGPVARAGMEAIERDIRDAFAAHKTP